MNIDIKQATHDDFPEILNIFREVTKTGDTYVYTEDYPEDSVYNMWFNPSHRSYVAVRNNEIVAMYVIRPNHVCRSSHIANAAYMVNPKFHSKGIGRKLGEHSLIEAKTLGYTAMQFNVVVSTNLVAVKLWTSLGFSKIATVPDGFQHKTKGLVDIYIMHKSIS